MLIDGEKYACEACVRGHRVSNCNHFERPLTHINKKGRPVSQCPHCRGLRKARSSHVKCECADKKGNVSPTKRACNCGHGQRCTCALKKDHLSPVGAGKKTTGLTRSRSHTDSHKSRLSPHYADPSLAVFQNGHHKPIHHRNQAGHELGLPYKIPRPHSIHGNSSLANASTDSLPLLSGVGGYPYDFFAQEDMVHSAHNSPALQPKVDMLNQLPQLDLSYTALNTDISSLTSSPQPEEFAPTSYPGPMGYFNTGMGQATPPLSAMSAPQIDLSSMDMSLETRAFGNDYAQSPAFGGLEAIPTSHPGLGSSSSGDVSDTDEYINAVHSPAVYANSPYLAPQDPVGLGAYGLGTADGLVGSLTPPSSMPAGGSAMPITTGTEGSFLGSGVGSPIPQLSPNLEQDPYAHHFTLQEAQKMAHPGMGPSHEAGRVPSPPQFRPTSDPTWATYADDTYLTADGFQAQTSWAR